MPAAQRPQLRPLEIFQVGPQADMLFMIRDPEGLSPTLTVSFGAALLASLMDGTHTLKELQGELKKRTGRAPPLREMKALVVQMEGAYLLEGKRFRAFRDEQVRRYLGQPLRPARFAGRAYAKNPDELRQELAGYFAAGKRSAHAGSEPPPDGEPLCGLISPHIDPYRGGPTFAQAYQCVLDRCDADLFVLLGTSHQPMINWFSVTRKDFETPLGVVRTDNRFIDRLVEHLSSSLAGRQIKLFQDEFVHRGEHSLEFQAVFLQYVLGARRPFQIVPVLAGSFHDLMAAGRSPADLPELEAFTAAMRAAAQAHEGRVCYVAAADLAHIGPRFGDEKPLDPDRLAEQSDDDRRLLSAACRGDAAAFFRHVAANGDRARICGLAPTHALLEALGPSSGRLLDYEQAVEPDGSACVSFAAVGFYR